ncbi:hypothetical protein IV58_GL000850 [Lactobacillus delbrueckii subsp. jakobsenii ZN7a-9 = DSM 26046]|uniref:hypothetical protein n=1 Tax=Lactobacillus delbrueckii TaxID=1584 RepID=UPI00032EACE5|nr:hypothetical protein [Lactobacillus delbrueckii]EOD02104.1 hypothetical protein B506_08184 [Lactobacillus delbrueckii subsp. jakobsenii ZN7a-9 = DSM 26046]KRO17352.1 hypothetical protein IV58_GL000850 [Lactobacillus delbrueckii subsp. jakobsenii ZN7a-9 = DSM 26046]TDG62059.1 hypothetical protein C5L19_001724 [Lactobacillus delbrueckii subsp. jakobsenii]
MRKDPKLFQHGTLVMLVAGLFDALTGPSKPYPVTSKRPLPESTLTQKVLAKR